MNNVEVYLEAKQMQAKDAEEVLEEFSDEIAEMRGKCIDIGCGPATITREVFIPMLPAESTVVGADVSKKMIDFAKDTHKDEKRLSFIELDIEADKLPSDQINSYDNVVSSYCLHWCQKLGNACKNIFDLLRPGGHALVLFLAHHDTYDGYLKMHENPLYQPYMEDVLKYIPPFQKSKKPRASFKSMLKESGFEVIHCSVREKYFVFKNLEVMKKHGIAINPFISRMPTEILESFLQDLMNDFMKKKIVLPNADGGSTDEFRIMDMYKLMIAYVKKPNL